MITGATSMREAVIARQKSVSHRGLVDHSGHGSPDDSVCELPAAIGGRDGIERYVLEMLPLLVEMLWLESHQRNRAWTDRHLRNRWQGQHDVCPAHLITGALHALQYLGLVVPAQRRSSARGGAVLRYHFTRPGWVLAAVVVRATAKPSGDARSRPRGAWWWDRLDVERRHEIAHFFFMVAPRLRVTCPKTGKRLYAQETPPVLSRKPLLSAPRNRRSLQRRTVTQRRPRRAVGQSNRTTP